MIGWVAVMNDGRMLRERDGCYWNDIDVDGVAKLWLESFEEYVVCRSRYPRLLEFIQFKTGSVQAGGKVRFDSQCIGWTDGVHEILFRMRPGSEDVRMELHPRTHFHPRSARPGAAVPNPECGLKIRESE